MSYKPSPEMRYARIAEEAIRDANGWLTTPALDLEDFALARKLLARRIPGSVVRQGILAAVERLADRGEDARVSTLRYCRGRIEAAWKEVDYLALGRWSPEEFEWR